MIEIAHQQYKVFIYTDHQYTVESADNLRRYNRVYIDDSCDRHSNVSNVAILVKHGQDEVASAILCDIGVFTGLSESSFIIEERMLYICAGNKLYYLNIPDLTLKWTGQVDYVTNFSVQKLEDDLLVHGEIEITRITKLGEIKWRFGGQDIWINTNGFPVITLLYDRIKLVDFQSNFYAIGFDGNTISKKAEDYTATVIYSYDKIIGSAKLEAGDLSIGGLYGDFNPNQTYLAQIQQHAWEFLNTNGQNLNEWQALRLNIQLENGLFLLATGGLMIEDSEEFPEEPKKIHLAGVDTKIIEDFIIENPTRAFVEYPWEAISIEKKLAFEDMLYKEIDSSGSIVDYLRSHSTNTILKGATVSALCINVNSSQVLFEIQSKKIDQRFALIAFKQSDRDGTPLLKGIKLFNDFDEFKDLKMYRDRNEWEK
ncbi:hypothetical protein [uncultured Sphingobacterium sp.]|uniref:hypothetical protein n=1 Tax=uncultured Sphingobacterium sp. TaxID=182688 RepID=UPI0025E2FDF4|nr:hypothetical protein [uncultured Sphingobacterium sp.]